MSILYIGRDRQLSFLVFLRVGICSSNVWFQQVSDIDGYEVSVTVDLDGVKDLKQASLQASNEVGSYTVELLCPPKNAAGTHGTSCSMFQVFDCPNSSAYTQIAVVTGVVVLLAMLVFALILCCYLPR